MLISHISTKLFFFVIHHKILANKSQTEVKVNICDDNSSVSMKYPTVHATRISRWSFVLRLPATGASPPHAPFYRAFLDGYLAILSFRRAHCINVTTPGALQSAEQGRKAGDGKRTRYRKTGDSFIETNSRRKDVRATSATPACLRENVTSTGGFTSYPVTFPPRRSPRPSETHGSPGRNRRPCSLSLSLTLSKRDVASELETTR